jgi:hypothetical protein
MVPFKGKTIILSLSFLVFGVIQVVYTFLMLV